MTKTVNLAAYYGGVLVAEATVYGVEDVKEETKFFYEKFKFCHIDIDAE